VACSRVVASGRLAGRRHQHCSNDARDAATMSPSFREAMCITISGSVPCNGQGAGALILRNADASVPVTCRGDKRSGG